jgi:dipeptidase E
MKLYLSSYGLGDHPQRLVDLVGANNQVAVIANARDFSTDIGRRSEGVKTEIRNLRTLGLQANEVDLRSYFLKPRELAKELEEYGMVWVIGGNTFILRKALKESGMAV